MYRASDRREHEEWLENLEATADRLDLEGTARSRAVDLFLSAMPVDEDRSKRAVMASSLYVGALVSGQERSQRVVADAADVSRLTIQQRWKEQLEEAGLDAPDW